MRVDVVVRLRLMKEKNVVLRLMEADSFRYKPPHPVILSERSESKDLFLMLYV